MNLAGLQADLLEGMRRVGLLRRVREELVFPEEEASYSATLKAIRKAQTLLAQAASPVAGRAATEDAYYLV